MADALTVRNEYRAQNWAVIIRECEGSGLTKKEFCRQRGISEKSYYYWLRKLRQQMAESAMPQLVKLDEEYSASEDLHIQYKGAELQLPSGVDMDAVAVMLRAIQAL
jgi:transposase-like protein